MALALAVPLIIVGGVLTYSHLQRWADKGYWPGAWWKIAASAACLGAGIWLAALN
jgi:hypothetical protein